MNAKASINGIPEVIKKMRHFNLSVGNDNKTLIPQVAHNVLMDMKANAPVETGRLRNALEARVTKTNTEYTGAVVGITREASRANPQFRKRKAFYPASQEYGWTERGRHHLGKPYIRPAFDKSRRIIVEKIAASVTGRINGL